MKKIIQILFLVGVILLFPTETKPETLNYQNTLERAISNSFDLKMAAVDISISKAQLKIARADLYPTLSAQLNTEYNKDLTGGTGSFAYAGNTMISPYTQFRDMSYLMLSYNLFDFGVTGKKIHIAKKEIEQKEISYEIQLKELKLKVLDLYSKAQQHNQEIFVKSQVLSVYEKIFNNKERLFESGVSDKISIMDEAVKIARAMNDIEESKRELKNILFDLSSFTREDYDTNALEIMGLEDNENKEEDIVLVSYSNILESNVEKKEYDLSFDAQASLESKFYDLEIDKKKAELSILKKQLFPAFRFYTGYSLYGQNPNNYLASYKDIGQRSYTIGVSSTYVFFDGFKNRASREKTNLEIEKLQYEKERKLNELQKQYEKTFLSYETYNNELKFKKDLLFSVKDKLNALERMSANGLVGQNDLLTVKADLLMQEFELEQNIINISSKIEEIRIMARTEGDL